ncbi:LTA synthase family protein [Bacillus sp. ISL-41]|uniref:LTA synthase family protein n=1 Tax=Bacillus sp. ISL-41 TaxID=2819127 RepID=UPI001BE79F81|nr:LTA synthase family protein [Bacillus sp. ISL-41]MBT2643626.1 LTA synthase family protein [Bacillus sp. ISL-41]
MYLYIFTLLLFLKTYILRTFLFNDFSIETTILIELSSLLVFLLLIEVLAGKRSKVIAYLLFDILFTTMLIGIAGYKNIFGVVPTYHVLFQLNQLDTVKDSTKSVFNPILLLFYLDIIIIFSLLFFKRLPFNSKRKSFKKLLVTLVVVLSISTINIYRSYQTDIADPMLSFQQNGLVNNQVLASFDSRTVKAFDDLDQQELKAKIRDLKGLGNESNQNYFGAAKGKNLIMIQVESLQQFPINMKIGDQEITPNINSLIKNSFNFTNIFTQIGAGNTSDSEFIFNTSLYPNANQPSSSAYEGIDLPGLPKLLKQEGYKTLTFHANNLEFWNRDELYPSLGIEEIYDSAFFNSNDNIGIGASDEVLFNKSMDVLNAQKNPFYAQLITLTSHHPFKLPENKVMLEVPKQFDQGIAGDYLRSVHYTDKAIGEFIEELKANGLYENSMIVIFGDHFAPFSQEDFGVIEELTGRPYQFIDKFNIPFIIHAPGVTDGGKTFDQIGGQVDFMPTVANMLGIPLDDFVYFGQDLINQNNRNLVGLTYYMPKGTFINDDALVVPQTGYEDATIYDIKTEQPIVQKDLRQDYTNIRQLMKLSQWYVENKLK